MGDGRYGDPLDLRAPRTLLHCETLTLSDGRKFESPLPPVFAPYQGAQISALRRGLVGDGATTCYREIHGAADGRPGWYVDRYGEYLSVQQDEGDAPIELPPAEHLPDFGAERSFTWWSETRLGYCVRPNCKFLNMAPLLIELVNNSTGLFSTNALNEHGLLAMGMDYAVEYPAHAGGLVSLLQRPAQRP